MSKSFDKNKTRQAMDGYKKEINERKQKLEELSESKQELLDARSAIEGLGLDEDVKDTIISSLISSLENVRSEGKAESSKLDDTTKKYDDTKMEIMDAESETEKSIDSLSKKSSVLEKIGINVLDESREQAEKSLQELREMREESTDDISELLKLGQDLDSL